MRRVMIARGSFGQPWIFDQTRALLEGRRSRRRRRWRSGFAIALDHARMVEDYEADPRGAAIEFRKHLGWYVKGLPGSAELRKKLYAVDRSASRGHLRDYLERHADVGCGEVSGDFKTYEPAALKFTVLKCRLA